jgi:WD40 repeat protein
VAGDDETVRIWEISTKKCLQILEDPGRRWGQITCLTWLGNWGNDDLKPIAFGTGRGLVVIYRRSRIDAAMVELASNRVFDASDPVESIAFNAKKSLLAITSHHGRIAVYNVGRNGESQ